MHFNAPAVGVAAPNARRLANLVPYITPKAGETCLGSS